MLDEDTLATHEPQRGIVDRDTINKSERDNAVLSEFFKARASSSIVSGSFVCVKGMTNVNIHYVTSGACIGYDILEDGRRHINSIFLKGDLINAESIFTGINGCNVDAKRNTSISSISISSLQRENEVNLPLREAVLNDIIRRHSRFRAWVGVLGSRTGIERTAFLFCGLIVRLDIREQRNTRTGFIPFNQIDLADILGLSAIHTNRILRQLKEMQLVSFQGGWVTVHDFERLARLAEFDTSFLV